MPGVEIKLRERAKKISRLKTVSKNGAMSMKLLWGIGFFWNCNSVVPFLFLQEIH